MVKKKNRVHKATHYIHSSIHPSTIHLFIHPPIHPSIRPPIHPPIHPSKSQVNHIHCHLSPHKNLTTIHHLSQTPNSITNSTPLPSLHHTTTYSSLVSPTSSHHFSSPLLQGQICAQIMMML
ncbi:hypothetical protein M758_9G017800 [Ceratodon purpureus]|nr:hypothetical protein M758_9G017800 [Ceratodon purpureus]